MSYGSFFGKWPVGIRGNKLERKASSRMINSRIHLGVTVWGHDAFEQGPPAFWGVGACWRRKGEHFVNPF